MSWIVFIFSGILLSAYTLVFYFYLKNRKQRYSRWFVLQGENSAKQKEIEEELLQLEYIELDLPKGVCLLPKGAPDPSLSQTDKDIK